MFNFDVREICIQHSRAFLRDFWSAANLAEVRIGAGTTVGPHCVIEGRTTIGRDNRFFQFSSIGAVPQDKKYAGEPTQLVIGDGNTIREFCTLNTGTVQDGGVTRIGDDNWIMAYVHIAHDCQLGSHIIIANATQLGGHVHLADWVFLGGLSGVHQFVRIGPHAMTAMCSLLFADVPPFVMTQGGPAQSTVTVLYFMYEEGFKWWSLGSASAVARTSSPQISSSKSSISCCVGLCSARGCCAGSRTSSIITPQMRAS